MRLKHDRKKGYLVVLALTMAGGLLLWFRMPISARQVAGEAADPPAAAILSAHMYDSGFLQGTENYNACYYASDGHVYYVLCSASVEAGGQMFSLDPSTGKIRHLGDLTEVVGEKGLHAIPQGKSHVNFVECKGRLYFATHVGYYENYKYQGKQKFATAPGYATYPGGHFLAYDLGTGKFQVFAKAPTGEGIIAMTMDPQRERLYGLTWPSGLFLRYDLKGRELRNLGPVSGEAENPTGPSFEMLDRCLVVDPTDGSVYFTRANGEMLRYRYDTESVETVPGGNLRKDYFGYMDPSNTDGDMAYHWLQAAWCPAGRGIYGIHGKSGYVFRFDPSSQQVQVLSRLVSDASLETGMYDRTPYGYLGFTPGPSGQTLYHLTGASLARQGIKDAEALDLVTYEIASRKRVDHGVVVLDDGAKPYQAQCLAVGKNGMIYTVAFVGKPGHSRMDLISFKNPQSEP